MALYTILFFYISWSAALHEGFGLPVLNQSDVKDSEPVHKVRTKRCSCNNQLDSECHYFCHLDIIWVNTPSKTTVYGLGSPIARRRRSTDRCLCANPADRTCNNFCVHGSENPPVKLNSKSAPLQDKTELYNVDLQPELKIPDSADPAVVVVHETVNGPPANLLKLLKDLMKAKSRAMKKAIPSRPRGSRAHKPGYS